jgi:F-type H+-transporting ATPase subunit epsilon
MKESSYLSVDVVDASRTLFSGRCLQLVAPAEYGEVCILPRHTPLLARLKAGEIRVKPLEGDEEFYYVAGGYLEVQPHCVTVLADEILRSDEIDEVAARRAQDEAEAILRDSKLFREKDKAKLDLVKALAQLRVVEHLRGWEKEIPSSRRRR